MIPGLHNETLFPVREKEMEKVGRQERLPAEWDKIIANHISDQDLICKILKNCNHAERHGIPIQMAIVKNK